MSPRTIKLTIEYDGAAYAGWQYQANALSIQQVMEQALESLTHVKTRLNASGRTDAGVHALGQVAHFTTESRMSPEAFVRGFNTLLPPDIAVKSAEEVPVDFSARHSAKGKRYRYLIYNDPVRSAHLRNYSWHIRKKLDINAMRQAAEHLLGEHDFSAFRSANCDAPHAVREIHELSVTVTPPDIVPFSLALPRVEEPAGLPRIIVVEAHATAFLKQMVRNIVGTLEEVGRERMTPEQVKSILEGKDRRHAGPTAPPQGLFLVSVDY
ncbi:MAG: tRNA pseudouridine(38-40) synthase TruA [Nitrospirota bacterium]|nr:tRNA pseudouridine(38-40) synthase TruA [Nitrospirota bacterium]